MSKNFWNGTVKMNEKGLVLPCTVARMREYKQKYRCFVRFWYRPKTFERVQLKWMKKALFYPAQWPEWGHTSKHIKILYAFIIAQKLWNVTIEIKEK
jgi:hypothetical protein